MVPQAAAALCAAVVVGFVAAVGALAVVVHLALLMHERLARRIHGDEVRRPGEVLAIAAMTSIDRERPGIEGITNGAAEAASAMRRVGNRGTVRAHQQLRGETFMMIPRQFLRL